MECRPVSSASQQNSMIIRIVWKIKLRKIIYLLSKMTENAASQLELDWTAPAAHRGLTVDEQVFLL